MEYYLTETTYKTHVILGEELRLKQLVKANNKKEAKKALIRYIKETSDAVIIDIVIYDTILGD